MYGVCTVCTVCTEYVRYIYGVCTIFLAGESPIIRSYMMYMYGSVQPYICGCAQGQVARTGMISRLLLGLLCMAPKTVWKNQMRSLR